MSEALMDIFGNEIKVAAQPRTSDRRHTAFAGAHGLTSMNLGTRGRQIVIVGRIACSGVDYAAARLNAETAVAAIEAYQWTDGGDYTYMGLTFYNCVFGLFQLLPDQRGRTYHYTSEGYVTVDFIAHIRELV